MATDSCSISVTNTLTAAAADTVTLKSYGIIQVVHHGTTTDPIFCRTYASGGTAVVAVSDADDNYIVMPGTALNLPWPVDSVGGAAVVSLISAGVVKYTIQVLPDRLR